MSSLTREIPGVIGEIPGLVRETQSYLSYPRFIREILFLSERSSILSERPLSERSTSYQRDPASYQRDPYLEILYLIRDTAS